METLNVFVSYAMAMMRIMIICFLVALSPLQYGWTFPQGLKLCGRLEIGPRLGKILRSGVVTRTTQDTGLWG